MPKEIDDDNIHPSELETLRNDLAVDGLECLSTTKYEDTTRTTRKPLLIGITLIVAVVILTLIFLSVFLYFFFFGEVDARIFIPIRNCGGDGFSILYYNRTTDPGGLATKRFLKYKYIEDIENDRFYNFYQAVEKCSDLNSTLWEILDGEEEWEAVIRMAREKDLTAIWLNAKVTGSCPEDTKTCLETEAEEGRGISVRWPTSRYPKYSRLYKPSRSAQECVFIDKLTDELLWATGNCTKNGYWGLCTKRDCFPE